MPAMQLQMAPALKTANPPQFDLYQSLIVASSPTTSRAAITNSLIEGWLQACTCALGRVAWLGGCLAGGQQMQGQ